MSSRTYASSSVYGAPTPEQAPEPARRGLRTRGSSTPRRKRRDPLWARLCVIVGALLMMGSGGVIVGGKVLIGQATNSVHRQDLLGEAGVLATGGGNNIDGPINMLLVGVDQRYVGEVTRSDTIVILHIPASHDQAFLISLPRDLRVKIPDEPKIRFKGYTTKINAAFAHGYQPPGTEEQRRGRGVALLAKTIRDFTGIRFNGAAIIDFAGFEKVMRELGGVTICVDQPAESIHLTENKDGKIHRVWFDEAAGKIRGNLPGYQPVTYAPGCQRLSAEKALDYSRIRKGLKNGDYDRQVHQQQLLKAIAKEATSKGMITDPRKLTRVMDAAGKAFTLDTQGVSIDDFLFTLKGVAANEMVLVKTNAGKVNPVPGGGSDEALTQDSVDMLTAVRDGKLLEFLAQHPAFVATA